MKRNSHGFTLLEVMIALSILALALVALIGHEAIAIQMSDFSNRVSQATLLAQGKMLDVEHTLLKDAMDSLDDCEDGDFHEEGFREFKWKACAYKLELQEGASEQMTEQFMAMLGGTGLGAGADGQMSAAGGQIAQVAGAIPMFLQQLEDQIRKVRVEVTWTDAIEERSVFFERFVTALGADPQNGPPPKDGEADVDVQDVINGLDDDQIKGLLPPQLGKPPR